MNPGTPSSHPVEIDAWKQGVRCVQQLAFLNLWDRLRGDASIPRLSTLLADDLRRVAEKVIFTDVVRIEDRARFFVRYQGRQITRSLGLNGTGKYLDEALFPVIKRSAVAQYETVALTGKPCFSRIGLQAHTGTIVQYERLLLPFSRVGGAADRILSVITLFSEANGFPADIVITGKPVDSGVTVLMPAA